MLRYTKNQPTLRGRLYAMEFKYRKSIDYDAFFVGEILCASDISTALAVPEMSLLCSSFAAQTAVRFDCYDELRGSSQCPGT